jgi:hypothetical protein
LKPKRPSLCRKQAGNFGVVHFGDGTALTTDKKLPEMGVRWFPAANEGIQGFDPVYEPFFLQKVQRPVYGRRRSTPVLISQLLEHFVSLHRLVPAPYQFQHPPAELGKAQSPLGTPGLGSRHGPINALIVLVATLFKWHENVLHGVDPSKTVYKNNVML